MQLVPCDNPRPGRRVASYARFSSHNQRSESIEIQEDNNLAYCAINDLDMVAMYSDEAKTGKTTSRADFQRMVADAKAGLFDFVVIYKVPRIMRNRDEMALLRITLRKYGVEILYSGEDIGKGSDGILQLGLKEVLAEWESAQLGERIVDGIQKNAERCMANGQPLYGWDIVNGYYVVNEVEAAVLRRARSMLSNGKTVAEIVRALEGHKTKRGKPITHNVLTKMLKRKQNAGGVLLCRARDRGRHARPVDHGGAAHDLEDAGRRDEAAQEGAGRRLPAHRQAVLRQVRYAHDRHQRHGQERDRVLLL